MRLKKWDIMYLWLVSGGYRTMANVTIDIIEYLDLIEIKKKYSNEMKQIRESIEADFKQGLKSDENYGWIMAVVMCVLLFLFVLMVAKNPSVCNVI
ncbi:MAG: hypothetical protein [Siphoviridae sp. ctjeG17]|nr:MAG: hypothetical protein [Siphoviridae sp. ctjeG17]